MPTFTHSHQQRSFRLCSKVCAGYVMLSPAHANVHMAQLYADDTFWAAGATRIGALSVTGIAILGLTKLNLAGPGLTPTVKKFWTSPPAQ